MEKKWTEDELKYIKDMEISRRSHSDTMYLDIMDWREAIYPRKEFPYREYGWRLPNTDRKVFPIQRDGFGIFAYSEDDSGFSILPEDLHLLDEIDTPFSKWFIQEMEDNIHECWDEDCSGSFFERNISISDLRGLLSKYRSGMPEWLYRDLVRHNYGYIQYLEDNKMILMDNKLVCLV